MLIADLSKLLSKPAMRALESLKIKQLDELKQFTHFQVAELHGMGPKALKTLELEMTKQGIAFKAKSNSKQIAITSIDDYIQQFEPSIQTKLNQMRQIIQDAAPDASEKISYQMPTFYLNGNLVHFAAYSHHIGFYPAPSAILKFQKELAVYKNAKGSVQFPLDQDLPVDLIRQMVVFRVAENKAKPQKK